LPFTAITFAPNNQHKATLRLPILNESASIAYEFLPTIQNTIKLEFLREVKSYKVSDAPPPRKPGAEVDEIYFDEWWIRLAYEHQIKAITMGIWAGYMPEGRYYYGKSFNTSPDRKIEETTEVGGSLKISF
jgi:hypothetical protein